jgi:hypothetical protein
MENERLYRNGYPVVNYVLDYWYSKHHGGGGSKQKTAKLIIGYKIVHLIQMYSKINV